LEKVGVIRSVEERIKTGNPLSATVFKHFTALAKGEGTEAEGSQKVLDLANDLVKRSKKIAAYKKLRTQRNRGTGYTKASNPDGLGAFFLYENLQS